MKKGLALLLAAVLSVGMSGCGSGGDGVTGGNDPLAEESVWPETEEIALAEEASQPKDAAFSEEEGMDRADDSAGETFPENASLGNAGADGEGYREEDEFTADRPKVKGIYVTGPMAGTANMDALIELVERTELNAMVIDIKNDEGYVTFEMDSPLVQEIGSAKRYVKDMPELVRKCKEKGIYLIARIVAFRDPVLAEAKPEWSLHNADGTVFRDKSGLAWVNPYEEQTWDYLVEVAEGAVDMGFDEVQFDYVRFSTDSGMKQVDFGPAAQDKEKTEVITQFTAYAAKRLHEKGAAVSADVYGVVIDSAVDQQIVGQDYAALAEQLDYLSPMIYPSHYGANYYNIPIPDAQPYDTVLAAMQASKKVLAGVIVPKAEKEEEPEASVSENDAAVSVSSNEVEVQLTAEEIAALTPMQTVRADVRPWLQDFTATWVKGHIKYGAEQIREQIQAVYDAGYEEWILWNAANRYTEDGLYGAEEQPAESAAPAEAEEQGGT